MVRTLQGLVSHSNSPLTSPSKLRRTRKSVMVTTVDMKLISLVTAVLASTVHMKMDSQDYLILLTRVTIAALIMPEEEFLWAPTSHLKIKMRSKNHS